MVGIIAAMDEEIDSIKELMNNISEEKIYNLKLIHGTMKDKEIILVKCGVGKVNAARTTQILSDNFNIDYVINVGTAGGLNPKIEIGDIVIGREILQHDFDITAGGHPKGYISEIGTYLYSDKDLIKKAEKDMKKIKEPFHIILGRIATGDIFVQDINVKEKIEKEFKADCCEMEGAAIAQVCTLNKIPFIIIRAISDKPNGNNSVDFEKYLEIACKRYAQFIDIFLS